MSRATGQAGVIAHDDCRETESGPPGIVEPARLAKRKERKPVHRVIAEYFAPHPPASTGLIVEGLASADFLVEIDATAVLP